MKSTDKTKKPKVRRDPRLPLGPGEGLVETVLGSRSARGNLTAVSLSGLAVTFDSDTRLEAGTELPGSIVQIGDAVIHGDLIVLNVRRDAASDLRVGGLFWPRSSADEETWLSAVPRLEGTEAGAPVMAIRCGSCHRAMRLSESPDGGGVSLAECAHCSQQHMVPDLSLLRLTVTVELAREVAREHRIDLPAAYSVLLEILTIEQVLDTYDLRPTEEHTATELGSESPALDLDPAFHAAIQAGTLTVAQAAQRGSRPAFASRLVARHGLSESVALDVADNKIPLIHAIRQRGAREPIQVLQPVASSPSRRITLLVAALALVVLASVAFESWQKIEAAATSQRAAAAEKRRRAIESTNTRRDVLGRVTEISGADPRHVLIAYCSKVNGDERSKPVEIVQPDPPETGVRLGIFTDAQHSGARFAIRIERRGGVRSWVTGGDGEPVAVFEAPDVPPLAPRILID